jgi:hypothetical protein
MWYHTSSVWSGDKTSQTLMTIYSLDCRFIEVAATFMLTITVSRMALEPTWPPIQQLLRTISLGVKYKTGHPFFPIIKVIDVWSFAFIPPVLLYMETFTF